MTILEEEQTESSPSPSVDDKPKSSSESHDVLSDTESITSDHDDDEEELPDQPKAATPVDDNGGEDVCTVVKEGDNAEKASASAEQEIYSTENENNTDSICLEQDMEQKAEQDPKEIQEIHQVTHSTTGQEEMEDKQPGSDEISSGQDTKQVDDDGLVSSKAKAKETILSKQTEEQERVAAALNDVENVLNDAAAILETALVHCEIVDDEEADDDEADDDEPVKNTKGVARNKRRSNRDSLVCYGDHCEADSLCSDDDSRQQHPNIAVVEGRLERRISEMAVGRRNSSSEFTSQTSNSSRRTDRSARQQIVIEIPRRIMDELFEKWQDPPAEIAFVPRRGIALSDDDLQATRNGVMSSLYPTEEEEEANTDPVPAKFTSVPLGENDDDENSALWKAVADASVTKTESISTYISASDRRRLRFLLFTKVLFLLGSLCYLACAVRELQWTQDVQHIPSFVLHADDDWTWEEYNQAQILLEQDATRDVDISALGRSAGTNTGLSALGRSAGTNTGEQGSTTPATQAPYQRKFLTWAPAATDENTNGNSRRLQDQSLNGYTVPTVPELFTIIQVAIQYNPIKMDVQYDTTYGYPTRIYINFDGEPVWNDGKIFYWTVFGLKQVIHDAPEEDTEGASNELFTVDSFANNSEASSLLQQELDEAVALWSQSKIVNYRFRCNGLVASEAGHYPWHVAVRDGSVIRVRDNFDKAVETDLFQSFYENEQIFPIMESNFARSQVMESPSVPPQEDDWDYYFWAELPSDIQVAASTLGYDEISWNYGDKVATDGVRWEDLSSDQQAAAKTMGYEETWENPTIEKPFHHAAMYKDVQWMLYSWGNLPLHVQEAATELGFDALRWDSRMTVPLMSGTWDSLSKTQQQAALVIGHSQSSWDKVQQEEMIAQEMHGERPPTKVDWIQKVLLVVAASCFVAMGIIESILDRRPHHTLMSIAGGNALASALLFSCRDELSTIFYSLSAHFFLFASLARLKTQVSSPSNKTKKWLILADTLFAVGAFNDAVVSYFRTMASVEFALGIAGCTLVAKILWCWSSMVYVVIATLHAKGIIAPPPRTEQGGFPLISPAMDSAFPRTIDGTGALNVGANKAEKICDHVV